MILISHTLMVASVVRCDQMCKWMKYSTTELQWVSLVTRRSYEWDSVVLRWKWDWQLACHVSTDHNYLPICTAFIDAAAGQLETGTPLWENMNEELYFFGVRRHLRYWPIYGQVQVSWVPLFYDLPGYQWFSLFPHLSLTVLKRIFAPVLNTYRV